MKTVALGIVLGLLLIAGEAQARELAIIANQSYPAGSISAGVLKEIYRGEKSMEGSVRIRPIDQKDPVIKKQFLGKILGTTVDGYNGYWIKRVFQEGGVPPGIKGSSDEVIQVVGQEPGAIGYVWKSELAGEKGVKVLLTIDVGE